MRLLFFILLLVNTGVFSYYHFQEQQASPGRLAQPALNAERIRLAGGLPVSLPAAAVDDRLSCWSWGGFEAEFLDSARAELEKLNLGEQLKQPTREEFWLHIPPQKNRLDADKKLAELRTLTIENAALLDERGKWRFAISLGVYPTEDAATVRLNQLKEKGVKSAKLIKREVPGDVFYLQQLDEKTLAAVNKIQTQFAETTLQKVDCQAT